MEQGGDAACWLHEVCESCGALVDGTGRHRPRCAAGVRELDVCALPRAQKHPTGASTSGPVVIGSNEA